MSEVDEISRGFLVVGRTVGVPQNEGTGVDLAELDWSFRTPPSANNDLVAWQDDAFVGPEGIVVDVAGVCLEVLHHDHALEARNALLCGKLIDPARCVEDSVFLG